MAEPTATLPSENTDAGALARLLLLETRAPLQPGYDRDASLQAMRLMRRTVENRLASPAQYAARGATSEQDIVRMGNQFAGFRDYPTLHGQLALGLARLLAAADAGQADVRTFVSDAVTVATEATSSSSYAHVTARRTAGSTPARSWLSVPRVPAGQRLLCHRACTSGLHTPSAWWTVSAAPPSGIKSEIVPPTIILWLLLDDFDEMAYVHMLCAQVIEMTMENQQGSGQQIRVGVRELRNNLTRYLREARQGTAVLITSHDAVIAEIRPPSPALRPARQPGALKGQIRMANDFDTLPADVLAAMEE